jgi:type VI secretion system protein ImpK
LALLLEEVLTVICRLRTDKPVGSDPEVFRERVKKWLSKAAREAAEAGYAEDTVTMAGYAVIAFLDEAVLNSSQPMFSEWPRRPLQEEIFGEFLGGEAFFENLEHLLNQGDSEELGDLIEVYLLCLSLGFQGRYAAGGRGELDHFRTRSRDKVVRIRGAWGDLSPSWSPPPTTDTSPGMDRVTRWMAGSAVAVSGFFFLLWLVFFVILRLDDVNF